MTIAVTILSLLDIGDCRKGGGKGSGSRSRDSAGGRGGRGNDDSSGSSTAQVTGLCVDQSIWSVSYDEGSTWTEMYPGDSNRADGWSSLTEFEIGPITAKTQLIVTCHHTGPRMLDHNGLFIANVKYEGQDYYTSDPFSDSLWQCIDDSTGGDTDITVYCPKAGVSNADHDPCLAWNPGNDEGLNSNSYWVWNSEGENTLTFFFDFADINGVSRTSVETVAMEQSVSELTLFERAYTVVDAVRKDNTLHFETMALIAGGGILLAILVVMFYGRARVQKEEYQELI